MANSIFISYRRSDTLSFAKEIYRQLSIEFKEENIFLDVDGGIQPGEDFRRMIDMRVGQCDVVLALIGPSWLSCMDEQGSRRILNPDDLVRQEIAWALQHGKHLIPIIVGDTKVPSKSDLPPDIEQMASKNAIAFTEMPPQKKLNTLIETIRKLPRRTRKWTEKSFLDNLKQEAGIGAVERAQEIIRWGKANTKTKFGTGRSTATLNFLSRSGGKYLFSIDAAGWAWIAMGHASEQGRLKTDAEKASLVAKLNNIPGIEVSTRSGRNFYTTFRYNEVDVKQITKLTTLISRDVFGESEVKRASFLSRLLGLGRSG